MLDHKRSVPIFSSIASLRVIAGGCSLLLLGCSDLSGGADQSSTSSTEVLPKVNKIKNLDRSGLVDKIAENAIQAGDDLYMIPNGIDDDGCEMFGPFSKNNPTVTAMYYRQADGGFNVTKDPASCRVEMVSLGTDDSGCEMYRAQPVNSDLVATDVVYYQDSDGRYMPRKPQPSCS